MNITIREPGSALTHFIAMLLALCAAVPLLVRAAVHSGVKSLTAMTVFMISMVLLYAASTIYHSVNCSGRVLRIFRKMDHMMIFILIAGTYTPVCLLTLPKPSGLMLLAAVWGIALVGIFIKGFWITCPKWFSSVLYIAMGWSCLSVLGQLFSLLPLHAFLWLLAGGLIYTAGGIIYALSLCLTHGIRCSAYTKFFICSSWPAACVILCLCSAILRKNLHSAGALHRRNLVRSIAVL